MKITSLLWSFEFFFTLVPYSIFMYHLPLILLSPIYLLSKKIWFHIERRLYNLLSYVLVSYASRRNFKFKAFGEYDKLKKILQRYPRDIGIVIANHQTPTDIIAINQRFKNSNNLFK